MNKIIISIIVSIVMVSISYAIDIIIGWDANTEPDLVGYKLHYGTVSKTYTTTVDVGNITQYTLRDLVAGTTYYFAATAHNDNSESDYSNELAYTVRPEQVTIHILDRPQKLSIIFDN